MTVPPAPSRAWAEVDPGGGLGRTGPRVGVAGGEGELAGAQADGVRGVAGRPEEHRRRHLPGGTRVRKGSVALALQTERHRVSE